MPLELPPDIQSQVDPAVLGHESVQRYNSLPELIKGHVELQDYRGRSIALPKADSKPEDVQKWRDETGGKLKQYGFNISPLIDAPPADPNGYEFKLEGLDPAAVAQDPLINGFRGIAHKLGINQQQAATLAEWFVKDGVAAIRSAQPEQPPPPEQYETEEQIGKILSDRFKNDTPQVREAANKAVEHLSQTIPELRDFLEGTSPYGKGWMPNKAHPAFVALLSEVARMQQQDFGGNVYSAVLTQDAQAAKEQAEDILRNTDNPKYKLYWSGDKSTVDLVEGLYRKAFPGERQL